MVRIFLSLAVFAVLLLIANLLLGFALGDFGESAGRFSAAANRLEQLKAESAASADLAKAEEARQEARNNLIPISQRIRAHRWLGIAAALVTVLVNCISMTYFIGTSRWCREVVDAYGMDPELAEQSRRLKRRSFPFAALGMLTTVTIVALGGAADPGGSPTTAAQWVMPHFLFAMIGILIIAVAFVIQANAVGANYQVIQTILEEAQRIRSLSSTTVS